MMVGARLRARGDLLTQTTMPLSIISRQNFEVVSIDLTGASFDLLNF